MQEFSATAFYLIGQIIQSLARELVADAAAPMYNVAAVSTSMTAEHREKAARCLEGIERDCESIGLSISAETVRDLVRALRTNDVINYNTAVVKISDLGEVIRREMKGRTFMYVPAERAQCYGKTALFGDTVWQNFPSARFDITEAGNCLAAARGTACVFHLMRTLEAGLTVLGGMFSVSLAHTSWGPAIDECEKKIRNMHQDPAWKSLPDWKEQHEFYSQAISYLGVAKDAWRNYTAHARGKYTEEEADLMLRNIRAFMQKLAERLHE